MIYEFLQGRLGNQMFQYAHARALQHRKHDAICFNLKHAQKEGWRLCYLNINKEVQYTNSLSDLPPHSALHLFIFRAIQSCWGRVDWKYQPILALFFNRLLRELSFFGNCRNIKYENKI